MPISGGPDYLGTGRDALWVKSDDGLLHRVDPRTTRVVRSTRVATDLCQGLGVAGDEIWTCTDAGVGRVDPATGLVTHDVPLVKSDEQGPIPIGLGHAWVVLGDGSTLVGIDLASRRVARTVALGTRCADVATGHGSVWVACFVDGVLLQVDPAEGTVVRRLTGLPGARRISVATQVWVSTGTGLARIDPEELRVTGRTDVGPGALGSLLATDEDVWVRVPGRFLERLDATDLRLVETVTADERSSGSLVVGFGAVWSTAYDDDVLYRVPLG